MKTFKQFFYEKSVLGLEEIIYLDGIGKLKAKLDTGNGAYNVIHGVKIKNTGDMVQFETEGGKVIKKPLKDTVTINVGAGNIEERPVVLFDMKMGNKVFRNVPFSIGDRTENNHKVLIGKPFIKKDLDALIDVGEINIAPQNIEVNY